MLCGLRQYTLQNFITDYTTDLSRAARMDAEKKAHLLGLQQRFTLVKVKAMLSGVLDGFRDLTRAGVPAFDFTHLNNVLISRDYRKVKLA